MPMPHRTQMQVIKRRLVGKEGSERVRELRAILAELPNYRSGPYADIRKWVMAQLEETRTRSRIVHRDSIAVRREGAAQIALVGPPNSGKSSLLQALSNVQIKTGDYAFTTTRPVPALTRIGGVLGQLETIRRELDVSGISLPAILAATKADEALPGAAERLARAFPGIEVISVSVLDDESLESFREAVWRLTGLVRVYLRHDREADDDPVALRPPASVLDVARTIHHELAESCRGARVWGPSARFEGQRVGRDHVVADGDAVEILT